MPLHRLEPAFSHLRGQDLQRFRVGKATGQSLGDQPRIHPRALGQGHHLGDHQGVAGDDHLVAGLGHLPGAHRPHVRNPLPQGQQHWPHPLDVRRLTANHDGQAAGLGARGTAGHRRIDPGHAAARGQFGGHFPGSRGFQAGEVQQQLTGPGALGDTLGAKHHLAHHLGICQAHQHQVGMGTQLRRRGNLSRPGSHQGRAFFRVAVPHRQRIARRQQPAAHRQAHQADSGKAE